MYFLKSRMLHWALIVALLSGMSVVGFRNISKQRGYILFSRILYLKKNLIQLRECSIVGEYSNPELGKLDKILFSSTYFIKLHYITVEELINWIQKETAEGTAFAGPMPITSTILLTTQRCIAVFSY
jgi:hypothetical protein